MAEIKVKIPKELEKKIEEHHLDASKIASESIRDEVLRLIALEIIASKGKLTEEDAIELGRKLKEGRYEKLKKEGLL